MNSSPRNHTSAWISLAAGLGAALTSCASDIPPHARLHGDEAPFAALAPHRSPSARPTQEGPATPRPAARHPSGSTQLTGAAFYGIPILQKSFYWDGNGEVDDSGLGLHLLHYVGDGVAFGTGINAATWWTGGRDVYSCELEAKLRVYPMDSLPVFVDGTTGFQLANDQIPPGGTVWNYTFGFGFGAELPVAASMLLQCGAFYHHISNALGRDNDRNPSQNEARLWVGFAHTL